MTALTPSVFDFVKDYAAELDDREDLLTDLNAEEGLVLFTREFFIQFFGEVFEHEILTFDQSSGTNIAVADKERNPNGSPADRIVEAFREFCQDHDTIIGELYDHSDERSTFQREFVPSLLEGIHEWAVEVGREDIADAAEQALNIVKDALAKVAT